MQIFAIVGEPVNTYFFIANYVNFVAHWIKVLIVI